MTRAAAFGVFCIVFAPEAKTDASRQLPVGLGADGTLAGVSHK
jgi:hypothetical protein